jgi:Flp pilus assembly protein TadD
VSPRDRLRERINLHSRVLLPAALVLIAGCSSAPVEDTSSKAAPAGPVAGAEAEATPRPQAAAPIERKRKDYPDFETDETGFTITEQVHIGGEARADYQNALRLLEQERYAEGISALVAVTEEAPDVTAPYIDLGIAYGRSGDFKKAEAALLTAAQLSPNHPIVYNELGILYRKTGRFQEARESYEKALAIYPGFHFARRNLGVLCDLYLADVDCALENYEAYMQSVGNDEQVAIWIADIRNRLSQ